MSDFPEIPELHLKILNSIKEAVIVRDLGGMIIYLNKAAEELFGYRHEELINHNFSKLVAPVDVNEEKRLLESIIWGEKVENYETVRIGKNYINVHVSVNLTPLNDEVGKIVGVISVYRNVSERRRTESRFQALLESAPDAMVIVNKFGQIILVNAQTEKLFGYEREELIGKEVEILIPNRYHNPHVEHRKGYFEDPRIREMGAGLELFGKRKDATEFPVEVSLSPLKLEEGIFVSAAVRDISLQKKAALELRDYATRLELSNRELEQFAYVASHDLQEPLRNITNFAMLLEETVKDKLDERSRNFLNIITSSTQRMKVLISELLSFSRIGRDRVIERVDCNEIMKDLLVDMQTVIKENNARIEFKKLPQLTANKTEMKQLFQNLVINAIKFRKKEIDPVINIKSESEGGNWKFSVSDNGLGIKPEYLNKIFLIFQRLHSERDYPGTGIGLATCKKIVELYEGRIWVTSEYGKGSTFYFTIPKENNRV
ncbi:MAG TPA: PAS domain S-box protein [Lentimicrobium sp.]|nr:PAS domain S-box protein [Lentimicrobium sp.]